MSQVKERGKGPEREGQALMDILYTDYRDVYAELIAEGIDVYYLEYPVPTTVWLFIAERISD
jgi:hypothetical protein